eukprot:2807184-Amphidinium_carterae.1
MHTSSDGVQSFDHGGEKALCFAFLGVVMKRIKLVPWPMLNNKYFVARVELRMTSLAPQVGHTIFSMT